MNDVTLKRKHNHSLVTSHIWCLTNVKRH